MNRNSITFLGTGTSTGVPLIGCNCSLCKSKDPKDIRLRSSAYIEYNDFKILIDCGPDFRQQALNNNITEIDALLLTHKHKDHTGGLDDLRALNFNMHSPIAIYCEKDVYENLKLEYSYAFDEHPYPGAPKFDIHIIENKPFKIEKKNSNSNDCQSLTITPVRVMHHKMPVLAFRIDTLCYLTDANYIPEEELYKLKDLDILTLNCVNRRTHMSHFSLKEAIKYGKRIGAKQTYLTHISHLMAEDELGIKGYYKDISNELPEGIYLAYDNLKLYF